VLTTRPPSLGGSPEHRPMRPCAVAGVDGGPAWLREAGERPRILVSRSTVEGPGGGDPMPRVVAVADGVAAEIVLVRPSPQLAGRPLPANVRVVGWVPLPAVLPYATAVVHHGGAGTVLSAFTAGIPQLALPGPGDRAQNAGVVAASGGGLAVAARDITAVTLTGLVTDPALAAGARSVQAEIAAMPPPDELVPELQALA
jgi:UDP:flavonoid glycosyltransferase YjiC (YdhE family)